MKKPIYFPLNTAHYSSVKSLNIRMNYDFAGYAIYIMTLQKLAEASGRTLPLSDIPALAFDFRCTKDLLHGVINLGFDTDGHNFFSIELNESLEWYDAKYNKASEAGKKSSGNMTPEQLKERGEKAARVRWEKEEKMKAAEKLLIDENDEEFPENAKVLADECQGGSIPLASDANNRNVNANGNANGNREETEKEEKEIEQNPRPTVEGFQRDSSDLDLGSSGLLECVTPQSLASASQLVPSLHTPTLGNDNGNHSNGNIDDDDITNLVNPSDVTNITNPSDITKLTNPSDVVVIHTPIKVEERSDAKEKTPKKIVKEMPSFYYTPAEVSNQIENYQRNKSKFFFGDNQNIVANTYLEFYNDYPTNIATIEGYEQVLYVYLQSALSSFDRTIDNTQDLNNALDKTESLTITPSSIMDLMMSIKADKNGHREAFNKIIAKAANIPINEVISPATRTFNLELDTKTYRVIANNSDNTVYAFKKDIKIMEWQFSRYGLSDEWKFDFNDNLPMQLIARTCWNEKVIEFNTANLYLLSWDLIKYVMLHEIAHALAPNDYYHGKEWEYQCELLEIPATAKLYDSFEPIGDGTFRISFSYSDIE